MNHNFIRPREFQKQVTTRLDGKLRKSQILRLWLDFGQIIWDIGASFLVIDAHPGSKCHPLTLTWIKSCFFSSFCLDLQLRIGSVLFGGQRTEQKEK